ncbi:hypothetical protein HY932_03645 [Candidatus Falkowbacteria bacterium]|nr:hypothetical protein [Candidatus Falkowbacteria bacterium]
MPKTKIKKKIENPALVDEVNFAKSEVSYFKGLSIFLVCLLVLIFFSFSSLFALMYLETRYISIQVDEAVSRLQSTSVGNCSCDLCEQKTPPLAGQANVEQPAAIDFSKWMNFNKYGFEIWFPNTWSYLDLPYQKQVHLFSDGVVREELNGEYGDVVVSLASKDNYKDKYAKEVIDIGGTYGFNYAVKKGTNESEVIIVPVAKGFIELHIYKIQSGKTIILEDIVDALISKFSL